MLRVSDVGVFVDATNSWGGGNGGTWADAYMFARMGTRLHFEWNLAGGRDMAQADFTTKEANAQEIERIARTNLPAVGWEDGITYDGSPCDSLWRRSIAGDLGVERWD